LPQAPVPGLSDRQRAVPAPLSLSARTDMSTMTPPPGTVTGGVDTHSDMHVAAALNHLGGVLATAQFRTTPTGYRKLLG